MKINFKEGYFHFRFFNQIRLDKVQWVHWQCPVSPRTQWTLSVDTVQSTCTCPWTMSRLSIDSTDNVHWVHGQCPLNPWTLSSLAGLWLDFVHGLTGLCPECPWILSRLSTESMVNVHWIHGQFPGSPLSPCPYGLSTDGNYSSNYISVLSLIYMFAILMHWWNRSASRGPNTLYVYELLQNPGKGLWRKTGFNKLHGSNLLLTIPRWCFYCGLFYETCFMLFFNKVKIALFYVISKPGIEILLGFMCLACLLNTWAVNKPKQAGNIEFDLKISGHPHPNFGIKENCLFRVWKLII